MGEKLDHIRKRLKAEGEKTIDFFEALPAEDWDKQIYLTGSEWRVREVLAHFISAERAYQVYLQDVLQGGKGAPDNLDIDQFNEAEVSSMQGTPTELMDTYKQVRQDTLQFTAGLEDADLTRTANHPWFEGKDVGWYLKLLYRHNTMHRMDIRKSLKRGEPLTHTDDQRTGRQIDPQS
jgi:hypothetical protein